MKQYLLDTNAIAHFLHDKFSMPEKINSVGIDNCYVSEITIAELYYGSYNSTFIEENLQQAEEVKATFIILPISKVLKQYGLQRAKAKKRKLSNSALKTCSSERLLSIMIWSWLLKTQKISLR